jgi:hypothetical protein
VESLVKQILAVVLAGVLAGCASQPQQVETGLPGSTPSASTTEAGAADPRAAVDRFLDTIKRQDIQATSMVWGTDKGPARDQMTRDYQEKAIIIMQCYLAHDDYRIVNDAPGQSGKRVFQVTLVNSQRERTTPFTAVEGPRRRWFVESAELDPVKDFCRNPPQN